MGYMVFIGMGIKTVTWKKPTADVFVAVEPHPVACIGTAVYAIHLIHE